MHYQHDEQMAVFADALVSLAVVENENDVMWANEELKRVNLEDKGRDDDCICWGVND